MNIPEIIPAESDGYCDLETGECVTRAEPADKERVAHGNTEPILRLDP
jgi:hypothetical protein